MSDIPRNLVSQSGNPNPSLRLICLPYAGAGIAVFHRWAEQLPPEVQVCAMQLPGRDAQIRTPPFTKVQPLVERLADNVEPLLDCPFAVFGHSMGGLIGFELVRALRRRNHHPVHFFVSACRAPRQPKRPYTLYLLPQDDFIRELRQRYGGIPDVILQDQDLLKMFLPILKADIEMVETYQNEGGPPFDCPISALGGVDDHEIPAEDLEPWRDETQREFQFHMFPGSHFFINTARADVLRIINQGLAAHLSVLNQR